AKGVEARRETAQRCVRFDDAPVADEQRPRDAADALIESGLERDLRADARRIADTDRNSTQHHATYSLTGTPLPSAATIQRPALASHRDTTTLSSDRPRCGVSSKL